MGLSLEQAKKAIKERPNKDLIQDACNYEDWIRFHSDFLQDIGSNYGYKNLLNKIGYLIGDKKKIATVDSFIRTEGPSTTKKIISKIKRSHRKIFDGKNPIFDLVFNNNEKEAAFDYLQTLEFDEFISDIFDDYYVNPCAFYVVDMPQMSEQTEPYPVKVYCNSVFGASYNKKNLDFILFGDEQEVRVYCNEFYRVFVKVEGSDYALTIEVAHGLGFCPAFQLSKPVNNENAFKRWCPISDYLNDLDYVVYYEAALKVYEAYGPFPIITMYEADCDYKEFVGKVEDGDFQTDKYHKCKGGVLYNEDGYALSNKEGTLKCPVCSERYFMGPASLVTVPRPSDDSSGSDPMLDSPMIKVIDNEGLNYTYDKVKERKEAIIEGVSGSLDLPDNKSVNEVQIEASFQRQIDTLLEIKPAIELAKIDLGSTILKLRYEGSFEKMEFSFGTDFYVVGASNLIAMYNTLRENKSSESVLNFIYEEYLQSKYRRNPAKLYEALIWLKVDPFPHVDFAALKELVPFGLYDNQDLTLKANLSSAINKFKSENNILIFGEFLSENQRIEKIKSKLISYVGNKTVQIQPIRGEV